MMKNRKFVLGGRGKSNLHITCSKRCSAPVCRCPVTAVRQTNLVKAEAAILDNVGSVIEMNLLILAE